jgi:MoaA/NifB/PqqE/SkfB family radical SAM enzyme
VTGGDAAAPVRLADPRRRGERTRLAEPLALPGRGRVDRAVEQVRVAAFFAKLAVKERALPRLHVRPLVAELFLTENCNLFCVSCNCWRETTRHELSTAEWCDVLAQLHNLRFTKVNFTGGEPLLRQDSTDLLAYATRLGIPHLHLNTNGILLDQRRRMDVLRAGVRSFNISIDGPDAAMHDAIRGKGGAFATTIEHLSALVGERESWGLKLRVNFTVQRDNIARLPEMARLAQRLGVSLYLNLATDTTFLFRAPGVADLSAIDPAVVTGALSELDALRRADPSFLPRPADLRYVRRHFTERIQAELPCAESQLKLMIHSRGEIGGCWGEDPTMSVRQRRIAEVIDSPEYRDQHVKLFRKECVGCGSNYSLNQRWRPASYATDLGWRLGVVHLARDRRRGGRPR